MWSDTIPLLCTVQVLGLGYFVGFHFFQYVAWGSLCSSCPSVRIGAGPCGTVMGILLVRVWLSVLLKAALYAMVEMVG